MKFKSFNTEKDTECITEIRNADANTSHLFVQTWVPDFLTRFMKDPNFGYSFFEWDKIINSSLILGSTWRCFGAFTESRLDGLLCLSSNAEPKIQFLATAPWNYFTVKKMSRIGSGLIYFTIKASTFLEKKGEFKLNSVPDAEKFYEQIGMIYTGVKNREGLKEYKMFKNNAEAFLGNFRPNVIEE